MRTVAFLLFLPVCGWAQFQHLTTPDAGYRLYFSSDARLNGGSDLTHGKIFALSDAGPWVFLQRESAWSPLFTNFYDLTGPEISANGSMLAFSSVRYCTFAGSTCWLSEYYQATVTRPGTEWEWTAPGHVTISRNGQFAATYWRNAFGGPRGVILHDLETGEEVGVPSAWGFFPSNTIVHRRVADDGTVLVGNPGGGLGLWRHGEVEALGNQFSASEAMISDDAEVVLYTGNDGGITKLVRYDVFSRAHTVLVEAPGPLRADMSRDASLVAWAAAAPGRRQVFVLREGQPAAEPVTNVSEGVRDLALSGDGNVAWVVTEYGRILRVDVATGAFAELLSRTPDVVSVHSGSRGSGAAPGTLMRIVGSGLAAEMAVAGASLPTELGGVRVKFGGVPMPLLLVSPTEIRWQVPWYFRDGPTAFELISGDSPFVTAPLRTTVQQVNPSFYGDYRFDGTLPYFYPTAVHAGFSALVTPENPARPGEVIHFYMGGLGPVDAHVPMGTPAPANPSARITTVLRCEWSSEDTDAEIFFAGLAPGMIGIYQVSLRAPREAKRNPDYLSCRFDDPASGGASGWVPVMAEPAP